MSRAPREAGQRGRVAGDLSIQRTPLPSVVEAAVLCAACRAQGDRSAGGGSGQRGRCGRKGGRGQRPRRAPGCGNPGEASGAAPSLAWALAAAPRRGASGWAARGPRGRSRRAPSGVATRGGAVALSLRRGRLVRGEASGTSGGRGYEHAGRWLPGVATLEWPVSGSLGLAGSPPA